MYGRCTVCTAGPVGTVWSALVATTGYMAYTADNSHESHLFGGFPACSLWCTPCNPVASLALGNRRSHASRPPLVAFVGLRLLQFFPFLPKREERLLRETVYGVYGFGSNPLRQGQALAGALPAYQCTLRYTAAEDLKVLFGVYLAYTSPSPALGVVSAQFSNMYRTTSPHCPQQCGQCGS